jgi:hypothetical protein
MIWEDEIYLFLCLPIIVSSRPSFRGGGVRISVLHSTAFLLKQYEIHPLEDLYFER